MKRYIITTVILMLTYCATSYAQNQNDTLRVRTRITELTVQRNQLNQRIKAEDKKRNSQIADVAPEKMELINLRQDSLCLELRSQLLEMELEIAELSVIAQGAGIQSLPAPQNTTSVQQFIQSLRQNHSGKNEEQTQVTE